MRINELKKRESYGEIFCRTLQDGFLKKRGASHNFTLDYGCGEQNWLLDPLQNVYYSPHLNLDVRRYIRKAFYFSPIFWRTPLQWALGKMAFSRFGVYPFGRQGFSVSPPIENAEDLLIMPGNRRVRLFDFSRHTITAFLKSGFLRDAIQNEIRARDHLPLGVAPKISYHPLTDTKRKRIPNNI